MFSFYSAIKDLYLDYQFTAGEEIELKENILSYGLIFGFLRKLA